jgi:hypothetical protein
MAKRNNDDWWKVLLFMGGGALVLYYTQTGRGEENNAALIPDSLEDRIDRVVARFNSRFGQVWVDRSFDMLSSYLKTVLPSDVVALVSVVYQVELKAARQIGMTRYQKQQAAVRQARLRGLT